MRGGVRNIFNKIRAKVVMTFPTPPKFASKLANLPSLKGRVIRSFGFIGFVFLSIGNRLFQPLVVIQIRTVYVSFITINFHHLFIVDLISLTFVTRQGARPLVADRRGLLASCYFYNYWRLGVENIFWKLEFL